MKLGSAVKQLPFSAGRYPLLSGITNNKQTRKPVLSEISAFFYKKSCLSLEPLELFVTSAERGHNQTKSQKQ